MPVETKASDTAKAEASKGETAKIAAPTPTPEPPLTETEPGGAYVVSGVKVDANGEPIGKKKKAEE